MSREHERRCRSGPTPAPQHQTAMRNIWHGCGSGLWSVGDVQGATRPPALAGRWPSGTHAITRTRKLSRSGTRMCHPGDGLTAKRGGDVHSILLQAQSTSPYRPGHTCRPTQCGGSSDHRRLRSDSPMAAATKRCCVAVGSRRPLLSFAVISLDAAILNNLIAMSNLRATLNLLSQSHPTSGFQTEI